MLFIFYNFSLTTSSLYISMRLEIGSVEHGENLSNSTHVISRIVTKFDNITTFFNDIMSVGINLSFVICFQSINFLYLSNTGIAAKC